jgi:hypothetical protein
MLDRTDLSRVEPISSTMARGVCALRALVEVSYSVHFRGICVLYCMYM